jgi:hypothetical protein
MALVAAPGEGIAGSIAGQEDELQPPFSLSLLLVF